MNEALLVIMFLLVGASGTAVVFTRDPRRQAIILSIYGLVLTIFFLILKAPDVAFSELTIGTTVLPLMVLVAVVKAERYRR
jgi:energy-converting hydrogenase B subunit D